MTFLQPWLLFALPLAALPVVIHLINQRRFQSVPWAAMQFLLAAKALSRGYTRLRQWLILLLRVAAVAAVVVAVSRPLSRGWLALLGGGRVDTAVVVLDRSPSMAQAADAGGETKLATARRQVAAALETLGPGRVVLIDSVTARPVELPSPDALLTVPQAEPAGAAADLPVLLQAVCDQVQRDAGGATEVWVCSDLRAGDWKPGDGAWPAIRQTLAQLPQTVRVTLLGYTQGSAGNVAVRVPQAELEPRGSGWQLVLDVELRRAVDQGPVRVPVQVELCAARATVDVELTGTEALLARHTIDLDAAALTGVGAAPAGDGAEPPQAAGWGRVSIPADDNAADNDFYFTFGTPPLRRTLVVADDPEVRRALELVAGIAPDRLLRAATTALSADQFTATPLGDVALVLWQAPLPDGDAAGQLQRYLERGGQVVFLPPAGATAARFDGVAWGDWAVHSPALRPASWRAGEALLAATAAGRALPVGELEVRRSCGLDGEATPLAQLPDGRPLLVRANRARGGAYFLATTPGGGDSDLATNGVVLYALVQRAIDEGLRAVSAAAQADADAAALASSQAGLTEWRQLAGPPALSSELGAHAGVYAAPGRLLAVNRPRTEDAADVVADAQLDELFRGVTFERHVQEAGGLGRIVEEVWRLFLVAMLLALIAEGLLCLPRVPRVVGQRPVMKPARGVAA